MKNITIMGAGLAGTLLSLFLARRGYSVEVFEARTDIRQDKAESGRSINLALSCRGLTGLAAMGLRDEIDAIMVPMRARAIHGLNSDLHYQPFGRHQDEHINAILRTELNSLLLNEAELSSRITFYFEHKLAEHDIAQKLLHFVDQTGSRHTTSYQHLIGADGASSTVRESLKKAQLLEYTRDFLSHGYKELTISNTHSAYMSREHLHLWPRDSFMLLGNPNRDDSITGSLFLPLHGQNSFAQLSDEQRLVKFFNKFFPDAYEAMPNLCQQFFTNTTGNMSTIKCSPWYYRDQCLLIGDAAHGVIPFFGQGMNSAFEDCRILNELLDQHNDNWQLVMPDFFKSRKPNTDAVAIMSMDNYYEIHHDIRDEKFLLKKQVELQLMQRYPKEYISKHVLVMFTNTPYAQALAQGQLQAVFLDKICENIKTVDEIDWCNVDKLLLEYDEKLMNPYAIEN